MISKIKIGNGIGGCLDYLMNPKKQFSVICSNGLSQDKKEAKKEFRAWASVNQKLKKNVLHIPLAFSPNDRQALEADPDLRERIVNRYIELMSAKGHSLDKTQYIAIEHQDTKHPHLHLVFNRVDENGKAIRDGYIALNSKKVSQQITKEFGLTPADEKTKKIDRNLQHGKDLLRSEIFSILSDAQIKHKYVSLETIKDELSKKNIQLQLIVDDNGKIFGSYYVKSDGKKELKIKTSAIDKAFTLKNLVIQHQLHILRKSLQDEYSRRRKLKTVINDLDYSFTKYARDESKMMDDLAQIMSLGLLNKSKPKTKLKNNFASAEELQTRREKTRSILASIFADALKSTHSLEDLSLHLGKQSIKLTNLNREQKILIASGNMFFLSTDLIPSCSWEFVHLRYENITENRKEKLTETLHSLKGQVQDLEGLEASLLPLGIRIVKTPVTTEEGGQVIRLSFNISGQEVRRNELSKELNTWLSTLSPNPAAASALLPEQLDAQEVIKGALQLGLTKAVNQADLRRILLENHAIETIFKYDSSDTLVGVRFNLNEFSFKGSEIGLSAKAIKKALPEKGSDDSQKPGIKI